MTSVGPVDLEPCDALLADGETVHIRSIGPDDAEGLVRFHNSLSPESVYLRFFSSHPRLRPEEVERFTHVDGRDRMALVATVKDEIVAVARYDRTGPHGSEAEVAFVVTDAFHGRGLGTLLLEHLAAYARSQGISVFRAETLWQNTAMQQVFRTAGFRVRSEYSAGVVEVVMDIQPTEELVAAVDRRDEAAEVQSLQRLLHPRAIAVIGAGREPGGIGHELFRNIVEGGFTGNAYPVHPVADFVAGHKAYHSVLDIPEAVDVAVLTVPAATVPGVVSECAEKHVHALVLITAGFAESGEDGRRQQDQITADARRAGMRVVGPNCMGIINADPTVSLNATFAPFPPDPGRVAFASQSGGLGIAVLQEANRRNIGLSTFVSMGNKADVSGNDLLQYWRHDPGTDVILLYLESFGNPRRFARVARAVSAGKPIIAVKAGRSRSGRRAANSHTAALASPDAAVDALFAQTGVIRVDTLEEMFDAAQVLSEQPLPAGRHVAIVGNAGGPGILAADACEANGLDVPELCPSTQEALRSFLPSAAGVTNPVDMVASASPEDYRRALSLLLGDEGIDAVVAVFVPPLVTAPEDVAQAIEQAARTASKPVVANFVGMATPPEGLRGEAARVPSFCFPEQAVRALARACEYAEWRRRDPGHPPDIARTDPATARLVIATAFRQRPEGGWLQPAEAAALLAAYGIATPGFAIVTTAAEAAKEADRLGYPVVLKATGPDLVHKTDRGGVHLDLGSRNDVEHAYAAVMTDLGAQVSEVMVQEMSPPGVEMIVGLVNDPSFGPLLMFGSGGINVELFADRAFRVLPLTDADAHDLVRSVKGSRLLLGYRGREPADVEAVEDLLLRVARLAEDLPEVMEMDVNPVICGAWGVAPVDVKVRIGPAVRRYDDTIRRLR